MVAMRQLLHMVGVAPLPLSKRELFFTPAFRQYIKVTRLMGSQDFFGRVSDL